MERSVYTQHHIKPKKLSVSAVLNSHLQALGFRNIEACFHTAETCSFLNLT